MADYIPQQRPRGLTVRRTFRFTVADARLLEAAVRENAKRAGSRFTFPEPADLSSLVRYWCLEGARALMNPRGET